MAILALIMIVHAGWKIRCFNVMLIQKDRVSEQSKLTPFIILLLLLAIGYCTHVHADTCSRPIVHVCSQGNWVTCTSGIDQLEQILS